METRRERTPDRSTTPVYPELEPQDVPPSALVVSVLALAVASGVSLLWPGAIESRPGLVWLLALVPVFLLSYFRGWGGAALAVLLAMVALVTTETVVVPMLGEPVGWKLVGYATTILVAVTLGAGAVTDLLHEKRSYAARLAYEDPLTGLANRRRLERELDRVLSDGDSPEVRPALLFLDLIRFKRINDHLGFGVGDDVLIAVGRRIEETVRPSDTVARVGGDEFAVLLPDAEDRAQVAAVAERLEKALWGPLIVGEHTLHLGAWIGHSLYPDDAENVQDLLRQAAPTKPEGAARTGGRPPSPSTGERSHLALESELVEALETDKGLTVHYQPVARLPGHQLVGLEALLRWHHPERGLLTASEFVPAAERMGIIDELERVALQQVIEQAAAEPMDDADIWTSVNLSFIFLEQDKDREHLASLIRKHELAPGRIMVEVTESITARDPELAADFLQDLRRQGLKVAVDDFGTGHSSLAYLAQFPLDLIKVDQSFVQQLDGQGEAGRLVEGVVGLAHGLELRVVAEGVETEPQRERLAEAKCDYYQGYLLGRAVAMKELVDRLEQTGAGLEYRTPS